MAIAAMRRNASTSAALPLLVLLLCVWCSAVADAQRLTASFPLEPLRKDWTGEGGFCGEISFQMIAAARGIWISQRAARNLAGPNGNNQYELLLGDNELKLCTALRFNCSRYASSSISQKKDFTIWAKRQLIAQQPVVFAAYISGGSDPDYDHIMPLYSVSYDAASASTYSTSDSWVWSNDYGLSITRALNDATGFFAPSGSRCGYTDAQGGCVPSGTCYGLAISGVNGLKDAKGVYLPLRLAIRSWESSSGVLDALPPLQEPPARSSSPKRFARYNLTLGSGFANSPANAGLAAGTEFTVARCDGAGSVPSSPATFGDAIKGCAKKATFVVGQANLTSAMGDATFGTFLSSSVTYFVAGRGRW